MTEIRTPEDREALDRRDVQRRIDLTLKSVARYIDRTACPGERQSIIAALAEAQEYVAILAARQPAPFAITAEHVARQRAFSLATFGPGPRTAGVVDHIRRELVEVEAAPADLSEWADVIILAFDGAQRTGADPQAILDAVLAKQVRNEGRTWPDWRGQPTDRAIEHDRSAEVPRG